MGLSTDPRSPGELLDGRYRLGDRLGHGGFGDVWRAEELLPGGGRLREVALKLLLPGGGDALDWAEEAKLLASFRHPSLVTVYAAGILGGDPPQRFVAMELLEGANLADVLKARGPIPWRRVLRWAMSAAAALDVIHGAGVVHLDLKPANLFLCQDGAIKVLDFGIARRAGVPTVIRRGDRASRTEVTMGPQAAPNPGALAHALSAREAEAATGLFFAVQDEPSHHEEAFAATRPVGDARKSAVVIGTPGFMAPEVLQLAEPTAAADAYALAVCVVQLATGHLPHAAPDEPPTWDDPTVVSAWLDSIRRATLQGELRSFDATGLPRGLAALLRRLLAVDPAERGVSPGRLGALFEGAWARPHGTPDPPYFGLAPYAPEGEGLLFGRDDDIARLGRELEYEPVVVLRGAAGTGKSSLATAGLVPHLARSAADGKDSWVAVSIVPGDDPDAALRAALSAVSPELEAAGVAELAAFCDRCPVGLVLLVDPLAGVVTAPRERAATLGALLAELASGALRPGLRVIASIGEEQVAELLGTPLGEALRTSLRFVGAPTTAAVRDIVAGPANAAGVTVLDADLVSAEVQRELRQGGARLPYVSLALHEWWCARDRTGEPGRSVPPSSGAAKSQPFVRGPVLQGARWKESGGVRGAVVRHAERVIAALSPADRAVAEEILLRLSATDGTPVAWDARELAGAVRDASGGPDGGAPATEEAIDGVLALLAREHVVRIEGSRAEIGHDAILRSTRFAGARLHHMDRLAFLERLREARVAWQRADGHADFLLHGALLDEIRSGRAGPHRGLTAADRAFVAQGLLRARRGTAMRWALAGLAALTLAGGALGKTQLDEAREAEARARAAAVELEQLSALAAKARRTEDPFHRAAYLVAAMERHSPDGLLPLDLAAAAGNVPRAEFLTLDRVSGPRFPWDDRWLLGKISDTSLEIIDFRPPEPDVIEDVELDFDPDDRSDPTTHVKRPHVFRLRPHDAALVEHVPFAFDTAFATRASSGEVKVFRLRDDGAARLAAVAPMRCTGAVHVAAAAPVLSCATDQGVARWDLRRPAGADVVVYAFLGNVAAISADGERVAATTGASVLLWTPGAGDPTPTPPQGGARNGGEQSAEESRGSPARAGGRAAEEGAFAGRAIIYEAPRPVLLARWSPREPVIALVLEKTLQIVDARRPGAPLLSRAIPETSPETARWDEGGLDVALCSGAVGRWHYLRSGGRAKDDPPPKGDPCVAPRPRGQPEPIRAADDYRELAERDLGPHLPLGGWRLRKHRFLSRDLVLFDVSAATGAAPSAPPAAARLLHFEGHDEIGGEDTRGDRDSVTAVEHGEGTVMFQVGPEIRIYTLPDGNRLVTRKGNFVRRCADGRYLAWLEDGAVYRVFDAWSGAAMGSPGREPGFVVGADGACKELYTQRLDGTVMAHPLAGGAPLVFGVADGYVYDARPIPPRGGAGPALLLSFSSGAMARIDEGRGSLTLLGYASPRASAIADGPQAGEIVYADDTGVNLLRPGAPPVLLRELSTGVPWDDLSVSPDGISVLLGSAERIAALDLERREMLGSIPVEGKSRFARWDDEGSLLAWSFDRYGGAEGLVIPRGVPLARRVVETIGNLEVEKGRLTLRR